jgi:hypothetical protein
VDRDELLKRINHGGLAAVISGPLKRGVEVGFLAVAAIPWFIVGLTIGFALATLAVVVCAVLLGLYVRWRRDRAQAAGVEPSGLAARPE